MKEEGLLKCILYRQKLSRGKTFANFTVLLPSVCVCRGAQHTIFTQPANVFLQNVMIWQSFFNCEGF